METTTNNLPPHNERTEKLVLKTILFKLAEVLTMAEELD